MGDAITPIISVCMHGDPKEYFQFPVRYNPVFDRVFVKVIEGMGIEVVGWVERKSAGVGMAGTGGGEDDRAGVVRFAAHSAAAAANLFLVHLKGVAVFHAKLFIVSQSCIVLRALAARCGA